MMLPVFLGSIDQSILASALPTIGRDLGDVHNLPWLITAYLIAATAVTPLYGKFADIHGRRSAMLIALGTYMVGCLISACSPNIYMLIGGRIMQGFGGGGLTAIANMVLGDVASPKDRGKYYMYFSAAFTTAGGCGPALGGWIADHLPWNVIFLWSLPLSIIAVVLTLTVLRRLPRNERQHRLDFVGAFLVMIASSTFMLALNLGGVRYPWLSPPILALVACALILGVGFVIRLMTAVEPLIPIAILADPAARFAIFTHAFGWGPIVGLNIFLPMYLQSALGWSPTDAGLSLIVLMVTLNSSAGVSSQMLGRVERYKLLPMIFMLLAIGSIVTLGLNADHMTPLRFELLLFLIGIGFRARGAADDGCVAEHGVPAPFRLGRRHDEFYPQSFWYHDRRGVRRHCAWRRVRQRHAGLAERLARLGWSVGDGLFLCVLRSCRDDDGCSRLSVHARGKAAPDRSGRSGGLGCT